MSQKVYFNQTDSRWRNHPYTSDAHPEATTGSAGCGPTCGAMVVTSSGKETVYPDKMCDISKENGYRASGGTSWDFFQYVADRWGFESKTLHSSYEAHDACKEGWFVAINVREGLWTTGGHYILAVGATDTDIEIYDPYLYDGKFDRYNRQGKVRLDGSSAWVEINTFKAYSNAQLFFAFKMEGIEPTPQTPSEDPQVKYVNTQSKNLNVRDNPNGNVIGSLPRGTQVLVYEEVNGWSKIGDGKWCASEYLSDSNPNARPSRNTVGENKKLAGYTYLWSNPDLTGTRYEYKANTTVTVLENVNDNVDYVRVVQTGREAYVDINAYEGGSSQPVSTVGQTRKFAGNTIIYSNSNLTGTKYTYKPNTSVTILENVNDGVDKVRVIMTGRVGYVSTSVYK